MWIGVTRRFTGLQSELALTKPQLDTGLANFRSITQSLDRAYLGYTPNYATSMVVGSWGKGTVRRPPGDLDMIYILPAEIFASWNARAGNKQSALLQDVRLKLSPTFSRTEIRADGQVVQVKFDRMMVEVVPAFILEGETLIICDTNNGGSWKVEKPLTGIALINFLDGRFNGNLRPLIRMAKVWKQHCNVKIKSFALELLAIEFLSACRWRFETAYYHDWIARDFFRYMVTRANGVVSVPGVDEQISLGDDWLYQATLARSRAEHACDLERDDRVYEAGVAWRTIFGDQVPLVDSWISELAV